MQEAEAALLPVGVERDAEGPHVEDRGGDLHAAHHVGLQPGSLLPGPPWLSPAGGFPRQNFVLVMKK